MGRKSPFVKGIVAVFPNEDAVLEQANKRQFACSHREKNIWRKMESIEAGICSPGFFPDIRKEQRILLGICGDNQKYQMNSGRVGTVS